MPCAVGGLIIVVELRLHCHHFIRTFVAITQHFNKLAVKKSLQKFFAIIAIFIAFGLMQKVVFLVMYHRLFCGVSFADRLSVLIHGLPMDCSIAGYLTVIPALLIIVANITACKVVAVVERIYYGIVALALALITCLDLALYGYWGFRLDMTPIFYFTTSPEAAMASAQWWQMLVGIVGVTAITTALYCAFTAIQRHLTIAPQRRPATIAVMALLTVSLFIPIRGGVTVSTMNISRSYFSDNKMLNHAAVNPAFSLLYSATHQSINSNPFQLMTDVEMEQQLAALNAMCITAATADTDTVAQLPANLLSVDKPDVYLVILESFSAHLMPSLGGEAVAVNLDSLAREGVSFTNFYANSFRTDRALPPILSGFPAQPTMSILKYVEKAEKLPGIPTALKQLGYQSHYYYGGDINFANINAYMISIGFDEIICDKNFDMADRTGKWGAHDHLVFSRALADADKAANSSVPRFVTIQTSSSHEPFEVPYASPRFVDEPQKNAFAYTDSCLMAFVDGLRKLPTWNRSLVIMVPDHLGAWPLNLPEATDRHHVPLVMVGGALKRHSLAVNTPGSQIDIAATLLRQLGADTKPFTFSKDLLNPQSPHFAVFTEPELIEIVTPTDTMSYNIETGTGTAQAVKAYLQKLYQTIVDL